jgi:hypothetical protein
MNAAQIQKLFDKHGQENLLYISMNNNRRIHVDEELRSTMVWDHENELLSFVNNDYVLHEMRDFNARSVIIYQGYDMLEAFIFVTDEKSKLTYGKPLGSRTPAPLPE